MLRLAKINWIISHKIEQNDLRLGNKKSRDNVNGQKNVYASQANIKITKTIDLTRFALNNCTTVYVSKAHT